MLAQLLVNVEEAVLDYRVIVQLVFVKIQKNVSRCDGFLKAKRELSGHGSKAPCALGLVIDRCIQCHPHISGGVGNFTPDLHGRRKTDAEKKASGIFGRDIERELVIELK